MPIRLRGQKAPAEVRAFVRWLDGALDVREPVDVHLCSRIFGYFDAPGKRINFGPYLVVALDGDVLDTIAHEFVHYEQWRAGKDRHERGVAQRARALVKRWKRGDA